MLENPLISKRALSISPSMTLEITARAKALKKEGRDICSLSAGEPDFETPSFIAEAAKKAIKEGFTRYGPASGDPELKEAISRKLLNDNKILASPDEILITNGGKQAIYNLLQVIINPGDEVLLPAPYWLSYPEIIKLAGGIPIIIETSAENNFKLDFEKLEGAITSKTKLLIINSPCNPTGKVISKDEIEKISLIINKNQKMLVMSDEIYEYLLDENIMHYSFASVAKDISKRVFTVNGFSKAWAMTGWRIGYLAGSKEVIKAASALQSQTTSNVCSFVQKGALAAITSSKSCINEMNKEYNRRRNLLVKRLKDIEEIDLSVPQGAFYAFPKILINDFDSISFCKSCLENEGLAIVPGIAFGNNNCIRLSFAASEETIEDGIDRLHKMLSLYKNLN